MTSHTEQLLIRAARAIDAYNTANEYIEAADQGYGTPGNAAEVCWDAAAVLRRLGESFVSLADAVTFAARRYERAEREEKLTGREYRGGNGEAA